MGMEGETGLISAVVSVGHSASQPANAGGETFLVPKTIQVTMNGLAIACATPGRLSASTPRSRRGGSNLKRAREARNRQ